MLNDDDVRELCRKLKPVIGLDGVSGEVVVVCYGGLLLALEARVIGY